MRKAVIAIVIGSCVTACNDGDTGKANLWPRTVEPRIAGAAYQQCRPKSAEPGRVVRDVVCGAPVSPSALACDELLTPAEAVRTFAFERRCLDNAIDALERFARADKAVLSDLAAAYYVRAQSEDRASDLLRALDAAQRAPRSATATFNLALIQEAVGLKEEAIASWSAVAKTDRSRWATEAREHLRVLEKERTQDPTAQWNRVRNELEKALRERDEVAVERLIAPFPRNAWRHFEEVVLPSGDHEAAMLYAKKLAERLDGERYVLEIAAAAARNGEGHAEFRRGLVNRDMEAYARASQLLRSGGSPLYLESEIGRAILTASVEDRVSEAATILERIDAEVRKRGDRYLAALFDVARGYVLFRASRYVESNSACDAASNTFVRLDDAQSLASLHRTTAGNYRSMGQHELAWREALRAMRYLSRAADSRIRYVTVGEAASAALGIGFPSTALQLQNAAVVLSAKSRELPIALRERARIEFHLERYDDATRDLARAAALVGEGEDHDRHNRRSLVALLAEVEGQALLRLNPSRAVGAFTRAISGVGEDELRTFRASLFAQRAEAYRRLGRHAEAERDLQAALQALNAEELQILRSRERGKAEEIWTSYFGRFKETYDRLVRQLVEQRRGREAFAYAERARAFEPLHLTLQLDFVPPDFRKLTKGGQPIRLEDIQRHLPQGTFLLQYCVTEERTFTWIVSRERFEVVEQNVGRREVAQWTAALQEAGRRRDTTAFEAGSYTPFEKLIAPVLKTLGVVQPQRLVIVPDGAMHGLPFAALRDPLTRSYLIEVAPLEIAGSASLYVFSLMRDRDLRTNASALLIGDPSLPSLSLAHGLKPLPAARREVEQIRELYAPRVDVLTGSAATVEQFLLRARDKSVVHFAGHSIVNPGEPPRSLLLLAPSAGHPGAIEARELLTKLDLRRTRLVFLSTCSSAGGFPVGPEGVAPLVRPLIAAGVPAVVGSLWDVEDATAERVSVSFHRHYGQGFDAAKALQAAQLEMLRNESRGLQLVLSWAPFQVIGHASSPFEPTDKSLTGGTRIGIHRTHSLHRDDGLHPH